MFKVKGSYGVSTVYGVKEVSGVTYFLFYSGGDWEWSKAAYYTPYID